MKYWFIVIFYTLLFGCSYHMIPDKTSVTYGEKDITSDDKEKTQLNKSVTQTWKWSRD